MPVPPSSLALALVLSSELEQARHRPVIDLPGVGSNLSDHALLSIELPNPTV